MVKDLTDTLLGKTLHVLLKLYECEGYSFYCDVPRVVNFDVSWEFSVQSACHGLRERLFKACLYAQISLMRQIMYSSSASLSGVRSKPNTKKILCEHFQCNHVCTVIVVNTRT